MINTKQRQKRMRQWLLLVNQWIQWTLNVGIVEKKAGGAKSAGYSE